MLQINMIAVMRVINWDQIFETLPLAKIFGVD